MFTLLITVSLLLAASFDTALCQRKVSRNAAVGNSEVKTVVNFNCPEEFGYYPHPSDCTQYYVCVFGGALLESCTGGLMYSHELQTCDWPRNVGCDGTEISGPVSATSSAPISRTREETRTRYTPPTPQPPQPSAIVTSRGQPRQLHHNQQEIIKQRQQQQLYADAEETLPPAEEVENDRQQRVYRGQPSTVGQVQKDRDGLRHSNAIQSYSPRGERIGVISFGTQQQQYRQLDDILTNDLTVKRRRKRQTQRSRVRTAVETWRGGQQNVQTSRLNLGPFTLQPPPLQSYPSYLSQSDDEFKPFIPDYHKVQTHTIAKKVPFLGSYPNSLTTFRPPVPQKHSSFFHENNVMVPQHTHLIPHNTSAVQISNPNIDLTTQTTYSESSEEEHTETYPEFNEYFGPPPSYFNTKNRYENIHNPFASPDFDFDKFLASFQDTTTEKSKILAKTTLAPESDEYHDEEIEPKTTQIEEQQNQHYYKEIRPKSTTPRDDYNYERKPKTTISPIVRQQNEQYYEKVKPKSTTPPDDYHYEPKYKTTLRPIAEQNQRHHEKIKPKPTTLPDEYHYERKLKTTLPPIVGQQNEQYYEKIKPKPAILPDEYHHDRKPKTTLSPIVQYYDKVKPKSAIPSDEYQTKYKTTLPPIAEQNQRHEKIKPKLTSLPNEYHYERKHKTTMAPIVEQNERHYGKTKSPEYRNEKTDFEVTVPPKSERHYEKPKPTTDYDYEISKPKYTPQKPRMTPVPKLEQSEQATKPKTTVVPRVEKNEFQYEKIKAKGTTQPKATSPKPEQNEYYYYYEDEDKQNNNEAPKKIYSSQIKPTTKVVTNPIDDEYYYEEEYDYSQKPVNKPVNISTAANKYSAKYQGKPVKTVKTTHAPETTTSTTRPTTKKILASETFIVSNTLSSTTTKPKTTLKQIRVTVPTTRTSRNKQRQKLTDNDVKSRTEQSSAAPVQPSVSTATATARALYNSSQYNSNSYDPYYTLYDDDVELYRDVDYPQQYNSNNNNNAQSQAAQQSYRRTPSPVIQTTQEEAPKRGSASYIQNDYNSQDVYQPATSDYNEDNSYNSHVDDQNAYRQINRQPTRGDRNNLNYIEEAATKRTTTTTTRKTTTTRTSRTFPPKKNTIIPRLPVTANENKTQALINTLREDPGPFSSVPNPQNETTTYRPPLPDSIPKHSAPPIVNKPAPFTLPEHLTTEKPLDFHYITKASRSTTLVSTVPPIQTSTIGNLIQNRTVIVPTTYSPPKFFLKSLFPKSVVHSTTVPNFPTKSETKPHKTLKSVRKLITPINVNYGLSSATETNFESAERLVPEVTNEESTTKIKGTTSVASSESVTQVVLQHPNDDYYIDDYVESVEKIKEFVAPYNATEKRFRTTVEIPPAHELVNNNEKPKPEPDQSPEYKLQPFPKPLAPKTTVKTTTDVPISTTFPGRASRVNMAIKSLIAFGGTRRQNVKCHDSMCNDPKQQRTSSRGRGSTHYSNGAGGNIVSNEVTVTVNRGTPASRPRPTLKPSTSIVSKASEFIDIYRFPPTRPDPIYPQPQPDKTAAKCRKDVCLLPDCYCGGKEIPGELPVEQVPQIVLLTFDDSVNDLNKGLYSDLFEKGRVNPNGCPIAATFYVSHEWTDYSQVQNLYSDGHEIASHTVSHSFGEQFSQKKWTREVAGQREILSAYGGVRLEDVRGMRAPFLSVGGNKMFKMLYDSNFTYDSSMPIYENKPPSWPYTLDYKLFHDCMIPPCPTRSYPGVWEVPMVMWQDLNGGRCSMGDACSNPPDAEGVFKMLTKNFQRHYTTNRAPFGLFYHAAWFTQPHHKEGFINFLDSILEMKDVWLLTNWQAIQWVRDPTPVSRLGSFQPFQCEYSNRPKRCNNPKVCNLWHKSGVRYMRTCQPCPDIYPWTGNTGIRSSRIDNDIED